MKRRKEKEMERTEGERKITFCMVIGREGGRERERGRAKECGERKAISE